MPTEAVNSLYAGLDLHKENVFCVIIDQQGQVVYQHRWPTELPAILAALEPYRAQVKAIAVESTFNWYWLVDGLQAAAYPVCLANPSAMAAYDGLKRTNDQTDARWIAELLRLGVLPVGYIYPAAQRPIRDMLRRRMLISRQATQTLLSLQSMVLRQSGRAVGAAALQRWTLVEVRAHFADECSQATAAALLELLAEQRRIQHALEKQVLGRMKLQEPLQRLLRIPGIGPILGLTIALETGPIQRFASAGNYASYCRAVDSRCESAGKQKGQNNRKNGNRYLAWAYVEAANFLPRFSAPAQGWFARKKARAGQTVAVKALAGKLAKAVFYMLRDHVEFDPNKLFA